jgi:hypothetical protein
LLLLVWAAIFTDIMLGRLCWFAQRVEILPAKCGFGDRVDKAPNAVTLTGDPCAMLVFVW